MTDSGVVILSATLRCRSGSRDDGCCIMLIREEGYYAMRTMQGPWGAVTTPGRYRQFGKYKPREESYVALDSARKHLDRLVKERMALGTYTEGIARAFTAETTQDEKDVMLGKVPVANLREFSVRRFAQRRASIYAGFAAATEGAVLMAG